MPVQTTNNTAVQEMNKELQYLERLKQEIIAQLPKKENILTKILIQKLNKELEKIDKRIQDVQKELEEKARASDLVEQDVLDKLSDVAKDVANGRTDDVVDDLRDAGQEAVKDRVIKEIDEHVDERHKDDLIEIVEHIEDGNIDDAVEVLKDGVKDEIIEQVDKHIDNPKVVALIEAAVEGVIEGDFKGLLEVVADGVVDIIEDKLLEFVQHLLKLLEEKIYVRIEQRLKKEVNELIDAATRLAIDKTGAEWTAKLVATVVRRLLRRSAKILKEEIKYLTSKQTLEKLLGVLKDAALKTLASGLKGRKIKDILQELLQHAEQHPEFQKIIQDSRKRLAKKFLDMAIAEVKAVATEVIDAFLRVHGNWGGTLITLKRTSVKFPLFAGVSLAVGASATIAATMNARRQGIGAVAHGKISGNGFLSLGLSIGYDLPIVGDVSIEGGIEGGPTLVASLDASLEAKNSVIHASIAPLTINASLAGRFYLKTPIPNSILQYIPAYFKDAYVVKQNVYYPIGKFDMVIIKTPKYNMTFNMKSGKYVYEGSSGEAQYYVHPTIKAFVKDLVDSIEKAADEALSYLDPRNIDLNPFDEDGWIGSMF